MELSREFPRAKSPEELRALIERVVQNWINSPARPQPNKGTLAQWDQLIHSWVEDESLPLLIRKFRGNRGSEIEHNSGRKLIPVDNSPAQWAFKAAYEGRFFEAAELPGVLRRIPVAMAMSRKERQEASFTTMLGKKNNLNLLGWKLAHIIGVGLGTRLPISQIPIEILKTHFTRLISPSNMFVVPKEYSGIGEFPEMQNAVMEMDNQTDR